MYAIRSYYVIGGVVLIAATGPLAEVAVAFGPWEFFSLFILALSMVAGLVGRSLLKGFLSGAIGLVVTVLGNDPVMGQPRLTLGIEFLEGVITSYSIHYTKLYDVQ